VRHAPDGTVPALRSPSGSIVRHAAAVPGECGVVGVRRGSRIRADGQPLWRLTVNGVKRVALIHHWDRNAAINLKNFAARRCGDTAEFAAVAACGEQGSDVGRAAAVESASVKQCPEREAVALGERAV
jgi:hypothetical protein